MPHLSRRPQLHLGLFEDAALRPSGVPPLAALPQRMQTVLTELMTRMLVAHMRGKATDREGTDDRA